MKLTSSLLLTIIFVSGCASVYDLDHPAEPSSFQYTDPQALGLVGVRPYPNPGDVCQVIGENNLTAEFLDDSFLLIGCPKHEKEALQDRIKEGARVLNHVKHWTLLHIRES